MARFFAPVLAVAALASLAVALFAPIGETRVGISGDVASAKTLRTDDEPVTREASLPSDTEDRKFLTPAVAARGHELGMLPANARSVLKVDRQLSYGQWIWQEEDVPAGEVTIRVDLRNQLVSAYRGGHEIGTAVILYGAEGHETPLGRFPILRKVADYHSRSYDAPMPHSLFINNDGVALHGSDVRYGRATHGCVGLPPEFAEKLYEAAENGDTVDIYRGPATV